jgi:hypothetical protein
LILSLYRLSSLFVKEEGYKLEGVLRDQAYEAIKVVPSYKLFCCLWTHTHQAQGPWPFVTVISKTFYFLTVPVSKLLGMMLTGYSFSKFLKILIFIQHFFYRGLRLVFYLCFLSTIENLRFSASVSSEPGHILCI